LINTAKPSIDTAAIGWHRECGGVRQSTEES
jgi:hypothetical protein